MKFPWLKLNTASVRRSLARGVLLSVLIGVSATTASSALAEANDEGPAVHKVYPGHTLGKIAKRYRVSVAAICHANDIKATSPLKAGKELVIPAKDDEDGSKARSVRHKLVGGDKAKAAEKPAPKASPSKRQSSKPGAPKVHKVYRGQTLGMIARRYNVSVAAILHANDLDSSAIHPREDLVIPGKNDSDGSYARSQRNKLLGGTNTPATKVATRSNSEPRIHHVGKGHTLGKIAARYHVSVEALCRANDIRRTAPLQLEQELVVPAKDDPGGERARAWRLQQRKSNYSEPSRGNWRTYKKSAWRRGYITLESPNGDRSWTGYVVGPGNKLLPLARQKITKVLGSWRTGKTHTIDARLVRLIARVSDMFGGRPIRVVSGYREHSHSKSSRHRHGRALDFSIRGVPEWALRDYLRTLPGVGVGYYPNSSFVHLDVREEAMYWVDVSGPGEAPRYVHKERGPKR